MFDRYYVQGLAVLIFICATCGYTQSVTIINSLLQNSTSSALASIDNGFFVPLMTTVQRNAIAVPATGFLKFNIYVNGLNYFDGIGWIVLGSRAGWRLTGNAGTSMIAHFLAVKQELADVSAPAIMQNTIRKVIREHIDVRLQKLEETNCAHVK